MKTIKKNKDEPVFAEIPQKEELKEVKSPIYLVVRTPFRSFSRGTMITNAEEIKKIRSCHEGDMVVAINAH